MSLAGPPVPPPVNSQQLAVVEAVTRYAGIGPSVDALLNRLKYLEARTAALEAAQEFVGRPTDHVSGSISQETLDGVTVAGARAYWQWQEAEAINCFLKAQIRRALDNVSTHPGCVNASECSIGGGSVEPCHADVKTILRDALVHAADGDRQLPGRAANET